MTQPTIGDMIAKYRELRDYVDEEEAKLKEWLKDHKAAMFAIQTALGVELQRQGLQNFKTEEDGTAYLRRSSGLKVMNEPELLDFALAQNRRDMLKIGIDTDAVEKYAAANGDQLPPGVEANPSVTCIIRR